MCDYREGDKIRCVRAPSNSSLVKGRIYTVSAVSDDCVYLYDGDNCEMRLVSTKFYKEIRFKKTVTTTEEI